METEKIIGLIAAFMTTIAFLPQTIKTWKSHSAKDLAWGLLLANTTGVALWLVYGVLKGDTPIIIANSITVVLNIILVFLKVKYKD